MACLLVGDKLEHSIIENVWSNDRGRRDRDCTREGETRPRETASEGMSSHGEHFDPHDLYAVTKAAADLESKKAINPQIVAGLKR